MFIISIFHRAQKLAVSLNINAQILSESNHNLFFVSEKGSGSDRKTALASFLNRDPMQKVIISIMFSRNTFLFDLAAF